MGLTLREDNKAIIKPLGVSYYEVRDLDGNRFVHCGSEEDAISICEKHPGFTCHQQFLPEPPKTVDVPFSQVAPDPELPEQKILPKSDLQEVVV
jgi:hypothetical protein